MSRLRIVLGDLNYFNKYSEYINTVPLNIGYLASYAKNRFENDIDISLHKDPDAFFQDVSDSRPDIVGLSFYYWNTDLDTAMISQLRQMYGEDLTIVMGGPSVDSDWGEQETLFKRLPEVDAFTVNEGENGFGEVIERRLSGLSSMWDSPIDAAIFHDGEQIVRGAPTGLSTDLEQIPSPYLSGILDPMLNGNLLPLIQTSRVCPYSCSFCAQGRDRGKLRVFPMAQVQDEILYIAKKYRDRPHLMMDIVDDNFGVNKRDPEIAEFVRKCSDEHSYPVSVYYFNDKKFNEQTKKIVGSLGHMSSMGLAFSLQTEVPETLEAIRRKNLSDETLRSGVMWAAERNIPTTTELIFGLPHETKASFTAALSAAVDRGFDNIQCHNLFILDGTELNRKRARDEFSITTKYRLVGPSYRNIFDRFIVESEEVVTSTRDFDYSDFVDIRKMSFLFYAVFSMSFYKWFFQYIRHLGVPVAEFFMHFMSPDRSKIWPDGYLKFVDDFNAAVDAELFDTREELVRTYEKLYREHNHEVLEPSRLNIVFATRLIYLENEWLGEVLASHLKTVLPANCGVKELSLAQFVLRICDAERVDLKDPHRRLEVQSEVDLISWRNEKYQVPLQEKYQLEKNIELYVDDKIADQMDRFADSHKDMESFDFYYSALEIIYPRSNLLYSMRSVS